MQIYIIQKLQSCLKNWTKLPRKLPEMRQRSCLERITLPQPEQLHLQQVLYGCAVLIICDECILPPNIPVLLLNNVVAAGVLLRLLPPQGHQIVVKVYYLWLLGGLSSVLSGFGEGMG